MRSELKRLVVLESDATYDAPKNVCWRLRGLLQDILRLPVQWLGHRFPTFGSKFGNPLLRWIYPSTWFGGWILQQERE